MLVCNKKSSGVPTLGTSCLPSFMDRRLIAHTGIGYTQTVKAAVREMAADWR